MTVAAPRFRQVCQHTGRKAELPKAFAADDFPSAADEWPVPADLPTAGTGHTN